MEATNHASGYTVISIGNNENRFNPTFVFKLNEILDNLDKATKGIVITGTGKFFSNGLDLVWMGKNSNQIGDLLTSIYKLLARILVFPLPTVALINGHAYGAGAFLALVCDFRVMNSNRGFFCLPEVNIGLPLSGFKWIAMCKLNKKALRTATLAGKKWNAQEALAFDIVDTTADDNSLLTSAIGLISHAEGKNLKNYGVIKKELYGKYEQKLLNFKVQDPGSKFSKL